VFLGIIDGATSDDWRASGDTGLFPEDPGAVYHFGLSPLRDFLRMITPLRMITSWAILGRDAAAHNWHYIEDSQFSNDWTAFDRKSHICTGLTAGTASHPEQKGIQHEN
jgi:hypothetical protein